MQGNGKAVAVGQGDPLDVPPAIRYGSTPALSPETGAGFTQAKARKGLPNRLFVEVQRDLDDPTWLDLATTRATLSSPKLTGSSSTLLPTCTRPGEVSTIVSGVYRPLSSAATRVAASWWSLARRHR